MGARELADKRREKKREIGIAGERERKRARQIERSGKREGEKK